MARRFLDFPDGIQRIFQLDDNANSREEQGAQAQQRSDGALARPPGIG
jgi:hypothetical protein